MMLVEKISVAKQQIMIKHPFYGMLLATTKLHWDDDEQTAATDGMSIFMSPKFMDGLTLRLVVFVLLHEVLHKALKHALRRNGREFELWNIACDYAINGLLAQAGIEVWEKAYHDVRFYGKSAEEIYDILKQEQKGGKGRIAGGIGRDLREPKALDSAGRAAFEREVNRQVRDAATMAQMAGTLPAYLAIALEGAMEPQVPWQALLLEYSTRVVKDAENWNRRSRRFQDWYFPSLHNMRMGELVIIGDTSGSMPTKVFPYCQAEFRVIVEQIRPERVRVIWADDCDMAGEDVFEPGDPVVINPKGRGGTDMRKPLRYVEQFNPIVVILITDGETPWPASVPYPLITLCTKSHPVPIGDVIRLQGLG